MTRQRTWQIKQSRAGKCQQCAKAAISHRVSRVRCAAKARAYAASWSARNPEKRK